MERAYVIQNLRGGLAGIVSDLDAYCVHEGSTYEWQEDGSALITPRNPKAKQYVATLQRVDGYKRNKAVA